MRVMCRFTRAHLVTQTYASWICPINKILLIESNFYLYKCECIKLPLGMSIITLLVWFVDSLHFKRVIKQNLFIIYLWSLYAIYLLYMIEILIQSSVKQTAYCKNIAKGRIWESDDKLTKLTKNKSIGMNNSHSTLELDTEYLPVRILTQNENVNLVTQLKNRTWKQSNSPRVSYKYARISPKATFSANIDIV